MKGEIFMLKASASGNGSFFSPGMTTFLTILCIAIAALFLVFLLKNLFLALTEKEQVVTATLISKSKEAYSTSRVYVTSSGRGGVAAAPAERGIGYYFTFEFEDGTQKTLRGDSVLYNVAVEGGSGTLDYKGTELISFTGPTEGTKPSQEKNSYEFVGVNNESWFSSKRH